MEFERLPNLQTGERKLSVPGFRREIEVSFEENGKNIAEGLKLKALTYLQKGYSYILSVLGEDGFLGTKNNIKFKKSGRHMTGGLDLHINISEFEKLRDEAVDQKNQDLQQSLIIHEILHHIVEEEHFSMFLEMIYMKEKGHDWRIRDIQSLFKSGKLPKSYQDGLKSISVWLGFPDINKMLEDFPTLSIDKLKAVFKLRYEAYCEEDPVLAEQILQIKSKVRSTMH